jgi:hypothetical protein
MLKRSMASIQQWLFPKQKARDSRTVQPDMVRATRRGFFTKAAVGAVSITGTVGLAKVVVDSVPIPDLQVLYTKDGTAGEQELLQREYVLMSDQEKEDMVQVFVDNYHDQG